MPRHIKNGIDYCGSPSNARSLAYNDTKTQFNTDNVQGAIEAVNNKLKGISTGGVDSGTIISQADYDALSEEEKNTGEYYIPDGNNANNYPANVISYDNSESGLIAKSVQGAIDEVKSGLDTVNSNLPVVLTNGSIDFAKYKNIVITFFDNSINSSAFSVSIDPNISRYHTISENFFANSSVYCFTCKLKMENKTITVQDVYYYDLVNNTIREVTNLPTIHKIVGYK